MSAVLAAVMFVDDDCPLTDNQLRILSLASQGKSNYEIAMLLGMDVTALDHKGRNRAVYAVKQSLFRIYNSLGVNSRTAACLAAIRKGWIKT